MPFKNLKNTVVFSFDFNLCHCSWVRNFFCRMVGSEKKSKKILFRTAVTSLTIRLKKIDANRFSIEKFNAVEYVNIRNRYVVLKKSKNWNVLLHLRFYHLQVVYVNALNLLFWAVKREFWSTLVNCTLNKYQKLIYYRSQQNISFFNQKIKFVL